MRSRCKRSFWDFYEKLPKEIQREARNAYGIFRVNPGMPGLHFEAVTPSRKTWSVRIIGDYRALGARRPPTGDEIVWFWIGTHNDYDKLIHQLSRMCDSAISFLC